MKILKLFAFVAVCFIMAACGSSDNAASVAAKIQNGTTLTEQDYTAIIEYCGKYAEKAQKIQDQINALPADSEEAGKLTDQIANLTDNDKYLQAFNSVLSNCTQEAIGEKNVELVNKYAAYSWFVLPSWVSEKMPSDEVGPIVEMPDSDTAGVIAVGAGEAVN